jgi:hypothetical protein
MLTCILGADGQASVKMKPSFDLNSVQVLNMGFLQSWENVHCTI